ncbi:MAG: lipoyl(octanoyl) transferase LipB [Planctomycetota bacterium]|nr:lipoyl(octanoyl) transferase LipB [Planctomycetota bacterium]MDI6786931.1 lipoyl(octanoyl) transferase LipB [Planctomycetota bacterium]
MKPLTVFKLGIVPYEESLSFQFELVERARESKGGNSFLVFLEHKPVITLGKNANRNNILVSSESLNRKKIQVIQTDRGGDVTYHGPGQLIGYPILALAFHRKTMKEYVRAIENTLVDTLAEFGINAYTKDDKSAGVWVKKAGVDDGYEYKIGFLGMRVSRGVTYHGFSLNINNELDSFNLINPCGLKNAKITSVSELLGKKIPLCDFIKKYLVVFSELFDVSITEVETHLSHIPSEIST